MWHAGPWHVGLPMMRRCMGGSVTHDNSHGSRNMVHGSRDNVLGSREGIHVMAVLGQGWSPACMLSQTAHVAFIRNAQYLKNMTSYGNTGA